MPLYAFKVHCFLLYLANEENHNLGFTLHNGTLANLELKCSIDDANIIRVKYRLPGIGPFQIDSFAIKDNSSTEVHEVDMMEVMSHGDNEEKIYQSSEEIFEIIETMYITISI